MYEHRLGLCRLVQERVFRLAEVGWQISMMHSNWVCMTAGSDSFHPCFELSSEEVDKERKIIQQLQDPAIKKFRSAHLEKVLKQREVYLQRHLSSIARCKPPQKMRDDMKRGTAIVKHSVVQSSLCLCIAVLHSTLLCACVSPACLLTFFQTVTPLIIELVTNSRVPCKLQLTLVSASVGHLRSTACC